MRICRSGRENVTNEEESGESVIHVGVVFVYGKTNISIQQMTKSAEREW
jgi:hypothetical protein